MKKLTKSSNKALLVLFMTFLFGASTFGQSMNVAPHKWILNAQGNALDVLAIYGGSMPAGGVISDFHVILQLDGVDVASAIDFEYCYVDNNYIAHFDKTALFSHPWVQSLAGTTVTAALVGSYEVTLPDGSIMAFMVPVLADVVEIVKPGKKK